jgi:hypothetical protein
MTAEEEPDDHDPDKRGEDPADLQGQLERVVDHALAK